MKATPTTSTDLHNNRPCLIASMSRNYRPASYLSERDDRGMTRAAEAMVSAYLGARADCNLTY